jgi:hypothetical protein
MMFSSQIEVKNIFRPEQSNGGSAWGSHPLPPSFAPPSSGTGGSTTTQRILGVTDRPKISAAAMKRIEDQLGRDALDETCLFEWAEGHLA